MAQVQTIGMSSRDCALVAKRAFQLSLSALKEDRQGNGDVPDAEVESMKALFKSAGHNGCVAWTPDQFLRRGAFREALEAFEIPLTLDELIQKVTNMGI